MEIKHLTKQMKEYWIGRLTNHSDVYLIAQKVLEIPELSNKLDIEERAKAKFMLAHLKRIHKDQFFKLFTRYDSMPYTLKEVKELCIKMLESFHPVK